MKKKTIKYKFLDRKFRYVVALILAVIISAIYLFISGDFTQINILAVCMITIAVLLFIALMIDVLMSFIKPAYFDYKEEVVFDVKWNWHWNLKKEILNLKCSCQVCGNEVYYRFDALSHTTEFVCKNCNKQIANVNSPHRKFATEFVKNTIVRKLKKENPDF